MAGSRARSPSIAAAYGERTRRCAPTWSAALPPVQADAGALQMILRNLIENSVRHAHVMPVSVRLTAAQRDGRVVLEYQDNGRGRGRGFGRGSGDLFGRGADSSGAGVGLYLVRRLMQRMGGRVRFDTAPGEGFRCELLFRVSLMSSVTARTLLMVEDERNVAETLIERLRAAGFQVTRADSVASARRAIGEQAVRAGAARCGLCPTATASSWRACCASARRPPPSFS